jgi:aminoglycoside phosphotransferase family enzyme/predicted kinase
VDTIEGRSSSLGPESWPPQPASVTETHVSVLFFVGDRVYKLKKPVSAGFLDFSTRELRLADCQREVELNRRLAPDIYLGVADVRGPDGEPVDHLVVMRRLPAERRLAALVRSGQDVTHCLRQVAHVVAAFHSSAPRSAEISASATVEAVLGRWKDNFVEMMPFVGPVLDPDTSSRVVELATRYLAGRRLLFDRRLAEGRACDGHGDLQADDVFCLDDGPRILDCIEFDDRLRYADVLADVAFLAMDLERLGADDAAQTFLSGYRELSGETFASSLADHYWAYRALVRAKVTCMRHLQGAPDAQAEAVRLFDLCRNHLERARVRLIVVGGLPGTGKSTLAAGIADAKGWTVLRSDEVRKELAGLRSTDRPGVAYREGIYGPSATEATYRELLERARVALSLGEAVVLDASWTDSRWRASAGDIAEATAADLVQIRCTVPAPVAVARLVARGRAGADPSDANPDVAKLMAAEADPWPTAIGVDTTGSGGESLALALAHLD